MSRHEEIMGKTIGYLGGGQGGKVAEAQSGHGLSHPLAVSELTQGGH